MKNKTAIIFYVLSCLFLVLAVIAFLNSYTEIQGYIKEGQLAFKGRELSILNFVFNNSTFGANFFYAMGLYGLGYLMQSSDSCNCCCKEEEVEAASCNCGCKEEEVEEEVELVEVKPKAKRKSKKEVE